MKNKKIAIIGAGMSGLILAQKLAENNEVVIFDKSRGIGGRMTTKRISDEHHFDHGAQFFTAKTEKFKDFCQKALKNKVIEIWNCNFAEIVKDKIKRKWQFDDHKPHFVAKPQMNNLCKFIAKDLNILLNNKIDKIEFSNKKWLLTNSDKEIFDNFDYLILAIPSHQVLDLIPNNFQDLEVIKNIKMQGCFTLMLGFKEKLDLEFQAALVKESILSWMSVNSSKPGRPSGFSLAVNSSNKWADDNIEEDLDLVKEKMIQKLQKIINFDLNNIKTQNIHRWRYANSQLREGKKSLFDKNLNLGICGDWLISGRVENAFLSGLDLFDKITK